MLRRMNVEKKCFLYFSKKIFILGENTCIMLLKNCKFIITQNEKREVLENKDVMIEAGVIKKIGSKLNIKTEKAIDCSEKIIMPGLINCHTHLGMSSLRGLADDMELDEWLNKHILPAEHKLKHKEIYEGAVQGIKESLRFGTTTVCEMYHPIEPVIKAIKEMKIRAVVTPTIGDKIKYLSLKEALSHKDSGLVKFGIAPHSVYACSGKLLKKCAEYKGIKHIHLAETRKERVDLYNKTKMLPAEYLDKLGLLDERTVLAHCIWLTKGELRLIANKKAKVAHCPSSNMKLASGGVMPLMEMWEYGITVGLGTDSSVSNNSLDLFREMRTCALLHKQHRWDPKAANAQKVLDMATIDGAKVLGIENLGRIQEGWKADVITLNPDINLQPFKKERIVSHLVYSATGFNVQDVIVDGEKLR